VPAADEPAGVEGGEIERRELVDGIAERMAALDQAGASDAAERAVYLRLLEHLRN